MAMVKKFTKETYCTKGILSVGHEKKVNDILMYSLLSSGTMEASL